jgi:putative flippase GtrA
MAVLAACTLLAKFPYLLATVVAVECTILHNFVWHERFTWRDRPSRSGVERTLRFLRFNGTNGAISLLGNLLLMRLLVEQLHLPVLLANGGAIVVCSLLNFVVGDHLIFRRPAWTVTSL